MVAALESGEIDAAHDVPAESFKRLEGSEGIVAVNGEQGGFAEISVNGGRPSTKRVDGIGNGNPRSPTSRCARRSPTRSTSRR